MTLSAREIGVLKCMYLRGYFVNHHKMLVVIQKNCHERVRKGLRKVLMKLINEGYVWQKGMRHFAVTHTGRDFLKEIGELEPE